MKSRKLLASIALVAAASSAQAGLISVTGGADHIAPLNNNFVAGATYNIGGNVYADSDVHLTYTYLGYEAGYSNDFSAIGGSVLLNNKSNSVGDNDSGYALAGLLDFEFTTYGTNPNVTIENGSNLQIGALQSFATMIDYTWSDGTGYDAVLFFDDSGAGPDDNHDDHIIGVTAVKVPEPGTLALFGLGLAGMGIATRKRQA